MSPTRECDLVAFLAEEAKEDIWRLRLTEAVLSFAPKLVLSAYFLARKAPSIDGWVIGFGCTHLEIHDIKAIFVWAISELLLGPTTCTLQVADSGFTGILACRTASSVVKVTFSNNWPFRNPSIWHSR